MLRRGVGWAASFRCPPALRRASRSDKGKPGKLPESRSEGSGPAGFLSLGIKEFQFKLPSMALDSGIRAEMAARYILSNETMFHAIDLLWPVIV
jgi:hypothetical protein